MKNLIMVLFILFSGVALADTIDAKTPQDTVRYKVLLKLKDKTTLSGTLLSESPGSVTIQSSVGKLEIQRENILSMERTFMKYYRITLKDGSVFLGGVIKETDQEVFLHSTTAGNVSIPVGNIQKKETITDESASEGSFPNTHSSRYLFAPSAFPLDKNEVYYHNIYFLYNSVHVGVSENVTVGGGVLFPVAAFLTPKVSVEVTEHFYLGAGALAGATIISATTFGVGYGLATIGSREHNITVGGGYAYLGADFGTSPIITISGMTRLGRHLSLVSENWFFRTEYKDRSGIFSLSARVLGKQHSVDLGIISYYNEYYSNSLIGLPFIGYVYKFNQKAQSSGFKY